MHAPQYESLTVEQVMVLTVHPVTPVQVAQVPAPLEYLPAAQAEHEVPEEE
jgi:hypothetical protein